MRLLIASSLLLAANGLASAIVVPTHLARDLSTLPVSSNHSLTIPSSMAIKNWVDAARRDPHRQGIVSQRTIIILANLFEGREAPERAAISIAALYDPLIRQRAPIGPVWGVWTIACDAIRALGGHREIDLRLIRLLNAMARLPDVTDRSGRPIGPGGGFSGVYWKDLPGLAIIFRQYAISVEPGSSELPDEGDWTDAQRQTLMNVVTFGALYLVHGEKDIGMSLHAKICLLDGLEEPYRTPMEIRRAKTNVPPAAVWILDAGEKILELCTHGKLDIDGDCSLGQWIFWKKRFHDIASSPVLSYDVRNIAELAVMRMEELGDQIQHQNTVLNPSS